MLEFLGSIDEALFFFINATLANPATDLLMPIITSDHLLRIAYAAAMAGLLWKGSPRFRWLILFSGLALLLADQTSSHLLKPLIGRLRPCHTLEGVNLLVGCGGGKAMPSSHAANAFAQAVLFAVFATRVRWPLLIFAGLVAISRVFVGVHYPGDVLVGSCLGAGIGALVAYGFVLFERRFAGRMGLPPPAPDNQRS